MGKVQRPGPQLSVLVSLLRGKDGASQHHCVPLFLKTLWVRVSSLRLLITKQNWEETLSLECNLPALEFERKWVEERMPKGNWPDSSSARPARALSIPASSQGPAPVAWLWQLIPGGADTGRPGDC